MTNLRSAEYAPHLYADMEVPSLHAENRTILAAIERCDAPARLRQWVYNAHKRQAIDVRNAAFRRLAQVANKSQDDNLDNAAQRMLAIYRTRLTASRCFKVNMSKYQHLLLTDGPHELLMDMSARRRFKDISQMLVDMDLADLTLEATIIRFKSKFSKKSVENAKERLLAYGFTGRFLKPASSDAHIKQEVQMREDPKTTNPKKSKDFKSRFDHRDEDLLDEDFDYEDEEDWDDEDWNQDHHFEDDDEYDWDDD